jgi:REP element-mobilizing transposase RayT
MWRGPSNVARAFQAREARNVLCSLHVVASRRPPRLPHDHYRGMQRYFLTINTFERRRTFEFAEYVGFVLDQFLRTCAAYSFELTAYCFMPDHVHALIEATSDHALFLKFVAMFKQRSGYDFKQRTGNPLWQDGFYDHVLRDEESSLAVAAYIVANPVTAGLCSDVRSYPFVGSSRFSIEQLIDAVAWRP